MLTIDMARTRFSDQELLAAATRLAAEARQPTADLIALLVVVDERHLWAGAGYSSLFAFCVGALRLSEDETFYRVAAARVASHFPLVLERLRDGRLTLTAVALMRNVVTLENHARLFAAAEGRRKREVQQLVASLAPQPDVPTTIRRLPAPRGAVIASAEGDRPTTPVAPAVPDNHVTAANLRRFPTAGGDSGQVCGRPSLFPPAPAESAQVSQSCRAPDVHRIARDNVRASETGVAGHEPRSSGASPESSGRTDANVQPGTAAQQAPRLTTTTVRPAEIRPLAPARYSLRVTLPEETYLRLQRAQDLLAASVAPGDVAEVLDRALALLVAQLERARFAAKQPKNRRQPLTEQASAKDHARRPEATPRPKARSRYIPAAIRREVWRRDQGRCTFVSPDGQRCGATRYLEFHHQKPFADGGGATLENCTLLCNRHNSWEAQRWFGEEVTSYRNGRENVPGGTDPVPPPVLARVKCCRDSGAGRCG